MLQIFHETSEKNKPVSFSFYLVVLVGSTFRVEGVGATHKDLTIILPGNHSYVILTFLLQNIKITGLTLGKVYSDRKTFG